MAGEAEGRASRHHLHLIFDLTCDFSKALSHLVQSCLYTRVVCQKIQHVSLIMLVTFLISHRLQEINVLRSNSDLAL